MSIILKHIWRNIKSNRLRSILIIVSLSLSAAVFYLCLNIKDDVNKNAEILVKGFYGEYDICVSGNIKETVIRFPECERRLPLETQVGKCGECSMQLYYGDIKRLIEEGLITVSEKTGDFSEWETGDAALPKTKALYYGFSLGDTFSVVTKEGICELRLVAYLESASMFSSVNSEFIEVFAFSGEINENLLYLALEDESLTEAECERLSEEDGSLRVSGLYDITATDKRLASISQMMAIILLLVIAVTFYVVSSTDSLIINYRLPVLAVFRSVGATAKRTNGILIFESAGYGLIAGIPGMLFGELFRNVFNTMYLKTSESSIKPGYIFLVPLFTVLINVLISLYSVLKAGKTPLKELMFRKQSAVSPPSKLQGIIGGILLFSSFIIAFFNKRYNFPLLLAELLFALVGTGLLTGIICELFSRLLGKHKFSFLKGSVWLGVRKLGSSRINRSGTMLVTVVIALVMVIYITVTSITGFFDRYEQNYPYDILIKSVNKEESAYSYLDNIEGVEDTVFEYWDYRRETVNGEYMKVCMVAQNGFSNGIEAENNLLSDLKDGEAVLDLMFARRHDYKIGDILYFERKDSESFELKIVGFCDSGVFNSTRITIVMTENDYFKYVETSPALIGVTASGDINELINRINDATSRKEGKLYSVKSKSDYVTDEISGALGTVKTVSLVPIFTILLALFGLVNNQLISFNQKRTEYAVLYSTAMSRKQLLEMIFSELCSVFLTGCAMGLLLSLWLSKIIRDIVFVSLSYISVVITRKQIALSLGLLFVLLLATALFPLDRLRKMNIVQEIKYE